MGIYLNPGYENFRRTLAAPIYVDKTMMLHELNRAIDEGNNFLCISRPRRFGKTIASNMISAYYSKGCDTKELFSGLKIADAEDFEKNLNQYHVIKIDLNSEYQNITDQTRLFKILERDIKEELKEEFPGIMLSPEDNLAKSIVKIHAKTGETFIIIIDEYDVLVREEVSESLFSEYLRFLNGLFKSDTVRPAISLAYLTGILPIVRDKIQSKLNNFREYTILNARTLTEFLDKNDVYTYLIHIGYLAYDLEEKTCYIPNKEVRFEWMRVVEVDAEYKRTDQIIKASKELLKETIKGNAEAVAKALDESHIHVTSNRSYNNEDALQSAIYLAYIYAINQYFIFREVTAGRGARRPVDVCSARTGA